jgi:hypothetical protein
LTPDPGETQANSFSISDIRFTIDAAAVKRERFCGRRRQGHEIQVQVRKSYIVYRISDITFVVAWAGPEGTFFGLLENDALAP